MATDTKKTYWDPQTMSYKYTSSTSIDEISIEQRNPRKNDTFYQHILLQAMHLVSPPEFFYGDKETKKSLDVYTDKVMEIANAVWDRYQK